jgi:hypothetical protein
MRATLPLLALLAAAACGSDDQTEAPYNHPALERAQGVEATTMQHKDDLDRAIDEASSP